MTKVLFYGPVIGLEKLGIEDTIKVLEADKMDILEYIEVIGKKDYDIVIFTKPATAEDMVYHFKEKKKILKAVIADFEGDVFGTYIKKGDVMYFMEYTKVIVEVEAKKYIPE